MPNRSTFLRALAGILLASAPSFAQKAVENGVANVVLSETVLPYGKENTYQTKTSFTAGKFTGLFVRAYMPKAFKDYDFDMVVLTIERPGFQVAKIQRKKSEIFDGSGFENRDSLGQWIVDPKNGEGDFKLGTRWINLRDMTDALKSQGKNPFPVKIELAIYKKVGEKSETIWDDRANTMVTVPSPVWDDGHVLSRGSFTIVLP